MDIFAIRNEFFRLCFENGIKYGKMNVETQSHVIGFWAGKTGHLSIQVDTVQQFSAVYKFVQCYDLILMGNPAERRPQRLYVDLDSDKFNMTSDDVSLIIQICNDVAVSLTDAKTGYINFYEFGRADSNNKHLVANCYVKSNDVVSARAIEKAFVHEVQQELVRQNLGRFSKAVDPACGNRLARTKKFAKDGKKIPSIYFGEKQDCLVDMAYSDPSYLRGSFLYESDALRTKAYPIQATMNENKKRYVEAENYERDFEISIEDAIKLVERIPLRKLDNFYSWKAMVSAVKSLMSDDQSFNEALLVAFNNRCACAKNYDAAENVGLIAGARVDLKGLSILSAHEDFDRYKVMQQHIDKYRDTSIVIKVDTTECSQYVGVQFPTTQNIMIRSATGTGKTIAVRNFLKDFADTHRFLVINHRVKNIADFKNVFTAGGVEFKTYDEDDISPTDNVITTVESVHKMINPADFDIVIIDEVVSVLNQLNSPNFKTPIHTFEVLTSILESDAQFVFADAYLNEPVINLLNAHKSTKYEKATTVHQNTYKNKTGERIGIFQSFEMFETGLMQKVRKGKRVVVATDSRTQAIAFAEKITDAGFKTLLITSENSGSPDIIKICADINTGIINYDAFVYSPTIDTGVSISVEHFDCQFCCFINSNVNIFTTLQMMNRVRTKRDNQTYVFFKKWRPYQTTKQIIETAKRRAIVGCEKSISYYARFDDLMKNKIVKMSVAAQSITSKFDSQFDKVFIQELSAQGYSIRIIDLTNAKATNLVIESKARTAAVKKKLKARRIKELYEAKPVDHFKAKTPQESNEKLKFAMVKNYGVKKPSRALVESAGKYPRIGQYSRRVKVITDRVSFAKTRAEYEEDANLMDSEALQRILTTGTTKAMLFAGKLIFDALFRDRITAVDNVYKMDMKDIDRLDICERLDNIPFKNDICGLFGKPMVLDFRVKTFAKSMNAIKRIMERMYGIVFTATDPKNVIAYHIRFGGYAPPTYVDVGNDVFDFDLNNDVLP